MTTSRRGGSDDPRATPVGDRINRAREEAKAWTEVRKDVEHLGDKVDGLSDVVKALATADHRCDKEAELAQQDGRLRAQDERIDGHAKRLDWSRGLAATAVFFLTGTLVTVLVTCNDQNTRDAETRVVVTTNAKNISKLEKSIQRVNDGRDADVRTIVDAISKLQQETRQETAGDWWSELPDHQKRVIIRAVGKHAIPADAKAAP